MLLLSIRVSDHLGPFYFLASNKVTEDLLKPLTTSQMPSENSHSAIGRARIPASGDTRPMRPNNTAVSPARSRGAPMSPTRGRIRGTRRDRYNREPSNKPFIAGMRLPESRNSRSYRATNVWLISKAPAPAPVCRRVTMVRIHATLAMMPAASRVREATKPSANPSFCFLTTG